MQDVRGEGGHLFSDRMKTPSGKWQPRLKGMAASGRRGGARISGGGRWGKDRGFGGAARGLAAANGAGRGWEFFLSDGWRSPPKGRGTGSRSRAMRDPSRLIPLLCFEIHNVFQYLI